MPEIRPARKSDAPTLAYLIDLAGEGMPSHFWGLAAEFGETPLDVGRRRAEREQGGFSYRNAYVVEDGGAAVAMLLGYLQPDVLETGDLEKVPPFIRPMVELEAEAPGSWYVNALATLPDHRGKGYGTRLLQLAQRLARQAKAATLSVMVGSTNAPAVRLYHRFGYREVSRRRILSFVGEYANGDWIMLARPVDGETEDRS